MRWLSVLGALVLAGCAVTDPRPVYHAATSTESGQRMLVVGVERDLLNSSTVSGLARELAFALAQRGRSAVEGTVFVESTDAAGRPMPPPMRARLTQGVADREVVEWLKAENVRTLIFLEVQIFEQVWSTGGKRTRVGLAARGRDLWNGEETWRAFTTPEVEDEPGRGFQLATESALGALARLINGEPEPLAVPRMALPFFKLRW